MHSITYSYVDMYRKWMYRGLRTRSTHTVLCEFGTEIPASESEVLPRLIVPTALQTFVGCVNEWHTNDCMFPLLKL